MTSKIKILDLIKKVLNKSQNNPYEEECATALLMAQRLALKYGIDMAEVEDFVTDQDKTLSQIETTEIGKMPYWYVALASVVSTNFKVKTWRKETRHRGKRKTRMVFFGEAKDVEIAKEIYQHALKIIPVMAKRYVENQRNKMSWSVTAILARHLGKTHSAESSYCHGFVAGMDEKFKAQVEACCMALAIIPSREVEEAFSAKQADMQKAKIPLKKVRGDCFDAGYSDGKNYECNNTLIEG